MERPFAPSGAVWLVMPAPMFNAAIARCYHEILGPLLFEPYAADLASRAAVAVTSESARVLELAAGTGIVTKHLLGTLSTGARLESTDLSEGMLAIARQHAGEDGRLRLSVADACQIPFPDRSFDLVVAQFGVMFYPDKVRSMQEARRVLCAGGRYIFNIWDSLEHNPIADTVQRTLDDRMGGSAPTFLRRLPFGYSDAAEIELVTRSGGFENVRIDRVRLPSVSPSAVDAARGFVEGTPVLSELADRGVTDASEVIQDAAGALARRFGDRPCSATMQALVVTAW